MMLMAALTFAWGCSSSDDDDDQPEVVEPEPVPEPEPEPEPIATFTATDGKPEWPIDWTWHDEAPGWQAPDAANFEVRMYALIRLDVKYKPYSSDDDLLAIFVNEKCRGVSMRNVTNGGKIFFPIIVLGNNEDVGANLVIKYYCANMKQTFNFPGFFTFTPDLTIGNEEDYVLYFGEGSPKYMINVMPAPKFADFPFEPSNDDFVAAFVGDECRGMGPVGIQMHIYTLVGKEEEVSFKYYSANKSGYYSFPQTVMMGVGHRFYNTMTFEFFKQ